MSFFGSFLRRGKRDKGSAADSKQGLELLSSKGGSLFGQLYKVYGALGHGGFGIVYKVYSTQDKAILALKTFRDEYLKDEETKELFRQEASVWTELGYHPYLVRAYYVDEVDERLYIAMEYIAPNEQGLNSLESYLEHQPPDLPQSLRWAIQFCHGMEYAYSKGVRCHRDIKPANIMISQDKTVKITDFGLAGVLGASRAPSEAKLSIKQGRVGFSILEGRGCGTPTHMPPEQFTNAASCDERSDIYAFGVVLYQMAAGGRLPFLASLPKDDSPEEQMRFGREMYLLHSHAPIPKLNSPLFPIIQRCLEKETSRRYQTFKRLRADLEPLLRRHTGETINPPEPYEIEGVADWGNKGVSLNSLGRFEEAIKCFDKAIEINPQIAKAWFNKGISLNSLSRFEEALHCQNKALEISPKYAAAWIHKGFSLYKLGRFEEAVNCQNKALEISPQEADAWYNKGLAEDELGRKSDAARSFRKYIELPTTKDASFEYARQRLQQLEGK